MGWTWHVARMVAENVHSGCKLDRFEDQDFCAHSNEPAVP